LAVDEWFATQLQEFFFYGLKKLEQHNHIQSLVMTPAVTTEVFF
jgi:hypothetical protein